VVCQGFKQAFSHTDNFTTSTEATNAMSVRELDERGKFDSQESGGVVPFPNTAACRNKHLQNTAEIKALYLERPARQTIPTRFPVWPTFSQPLRLIPELSSFTVFSAQAMRGVLWAMPKRPRASSKIMPPCPFTRAFR